MKKFFSNILVISTIAILATACSGEKTDDTVTETEPAITEEVVNDAVGEDTKEVETVEALTIGLMGSIENIPFLIAEEEGLYDKYGAVVTVERFVSAKDRDIAMGAGAINSATMDLVAVALNNKAGVEIVAINTPYSYFGLVAPAGSDLQTVADLKGKSVVISTNSVIEYTLDRMVQNAGLTVDDITKEDVPPMPTRMELLLAGQVDAGLMPDPFASTILANGGTEITSNLDLGIQATAFGIDRNYLDANYDNVVNAFLAYNEACDFLNNGGVEQYEDYIIDVVGYDESYRGNLPIREFQKYKVPDRERFEDVMAWCVDKGIIETPYTYEEYVVELNLNK